MLLAGSLTVTGKTDFPFRITYMYYNNDYRMVMNAEAVTVALAVVLCTHCGPVRLERFSNIYCCQRRGSIGRPS